MPSAPAARRSRFVALLMDADLYIAILLLIFVMAATLFGVVARYGFSLSLQSLDEVSIIVFVWFLYFSMIYCIRTDANIFVNVFDSRLSDRMIRISEIIASLIVLIFTAMMTKYSVDLVAYNLQRTGGKTPMMSIPYYAAYAILPFSFFVFSVVTAWRATRLILRLIEARGPDKPSGGEAEE